MQQFLLYKAHCSDERGEEGGGQHSCLEGKQFKQFTTYFTVKERKGGNLLSDGRRRNGNGSISGARPCIDIAPPLQLLDLDPPRAIRDFPSNTEKWGIFFGRRRRDGRRSKKRRLLSYSPLRSPPDNQPFPKSVNKDFLRDGSEGEGGEEGEWSISEMLSSCLASGK